MKGVILDARSLGKGEVDLAPVTDLLDAWEVHEITNPDEVAARIADADVVLSNKVPLTAEALAGADNLRLISVMATGTNNIDLDAARRHDMIVSNAVGYATPSVVQHTMNLILTLSTRLIDYVDDVRAGAWQQSPAFCLLDHPISEVAGKKLGIVGYGELGSNVARIAEAFGMEVLVSRKVGESDSTPGRIPFEDLIARVDYLSLHCPLTPATRGMINSKTLRAMKPGAFLINTARGGLVDSRALIAALESGTIAGAAIDVLDREPPADDEILLKGTPANLLVTPHNAWGAIESRQRLVEQMRENIQAWLDGSPVRAVS